MSTDTENLTADGIWHVVYCRPRQEIRAQQHLANQGFDTFLPRFCSGKVAGKGQMDLLFPRYIFVKPKTDIAAAWSAIRSTRGVVGLVRFGMTLATISDATIRQINQLQLTMTFEPAFKAGESVVIEQGTYQGIQAIYQCADGDKRSVLLIQLLQQPVPVVLENNEFRKVS